MGAAEALGSGDGISLHDLRPLVGSTVAAETVGGPIEGTLLSCTSRSAWIVVDDETGRSAHYLRPLHVGPVLGPTSEQLVEGPGPEVKTRR